jgi:hypothetical protein
MRAASRLVSRSHTSRMRPSCGPPSAPGKHVRAAVAHPEPEQVLHRRRRRVPGGSVSERAPDITEEANRRAESTTGLVAKVGPAWSRVSCPDPAIVHAGRSFTAIMILFSYCCIGSFPQARRPGSGPSRHFRVATGQWRRRDAGLGACGAAAVRGDAAAKRPPRPREPRLQLPRGCRCPVSV